MPTTATLPDALSDSARSFAAGPHRLLIGGERPDAADGRTFETVDPATGRVIAEVAHAGTEDVDRAVRAAREAFEDGRWSGVAAAQRTRALLAFADSLDANADQLAQLESLDNGKPVKVAKRVDVHLAAEHLRYFAGWPTRIAGDVLPVAQADMHCYTRKEPVGVCAQIIPWNFPLLMAAWKIGPALAAGCTIVLKPAGQTPLTALRLGELALEAGLPDGVLNVISGDGETGAALVDHDDVDKVAFTGSTAVGREIGSKAGRALKRVTLELGGKSPNIILPDADLEAAIKGSYQAIYYNTGQACNAGSRLFVHRDQFDEVVSGLVEAAGKARVGPGLEPGTQLGPLISAEQEERVRGYIDSGKSEGAELVTGGGKPDGEGYFVEPTLFSRHERRPHDRPRGDLRPGAGRAALRLDRGGGTPSERHRLWARGGRLDPRPRQGPQACGAPAGGRHLGQHLERRRSRGAVRGLQGLGRRARARPRRAERLPREQDGLDQPRLKRSGSKGPRSRSVGSPQMP